VNGQTYEAQRYDFTTGLSTVGDWPEEAVARYRPGTRAACYYNPQNPAEAVLERGTHADPAVLYAAGIFGLIGLAFFIRAGRAFIRRGKFGESELELRHGPARLGGALDGVVRFSHRFDTKTSFHVRLACIRGHLAGGRYGHGESEVLWHQTEEVESDDGQTLRVRFALPELGRTTEDNYVRILWRLDVTAKVPGVDFAAQFEVPVTD
jgi:hypothetical protein